MPIASETTRCNDSGAALGKKSQDENRQTISFGSVWSCGSNKSCCTWRAARSSTRTGDRSRVRFAYPGDVQWYSLWPRDTLSRQHVRRSVIIAASFSSLLLGFPAFLQITQTLMSSDILTRLSLVHLVFTMEHLRVLVLGNLSLREQPISGALFFSCSIRYQ